MALTHIGNLSALAKGLRTAFLQHQKNNIGDIILPNSNVLQNNAYLLEYYYYSRAKDWKKLIQTNKNNYQKIWVSFDNQLLDMQPNEQLPFGIAVLTWLPGQMTNIHEHPENGCVMMPLRGMLTEEIFIMNESSTNSYISQKKNILIPGITSFINNKIGLHQVKNNGKHTAVSLHVYPLLA